MFAFDKATLRYLAVNDAALRVYGYTRDEFLALTIKDLRPPEDVEQILASLRASTAPSASEAPRRHRLKDGSLRWMHVVWADHEWEGRAVRVVLADDVTATTARTRDLTLTLEGMSDAFFTLDGAWRFTYVNGEAERILRRSREELLGAMIWDVFPETRGTIFQQAYERARVSAVTVTFEAYDAPSGRWLEVRAQPADGRLAVTFRDITALRAEKDALRAAEARFTLLAEVTSDAIWDWDLATDAVWWNAALETHLKLRRDEAATITAFFECIHPDDRQRAVSGLRAALDGGAAHWADEFRLVRRDGSIAVVLDRGAVFRDAAGKAVRMIGAMTDLTARDAPQEQLREQATLLDHAQDAIIVRDLSHRVLFWNRSAERKYGWSRPEALGLSITDLVYRDLEPDAFEAATAQVLERGEWSGELSQRAKDGRTLIVEGRWTLLRDPQGNPKSVLTINTDVTERKSLEKQFLRAQRLESLGTLAGGIAHDLNNVLAPIMMTASSLQFDEPDPARREDLKDIHTAAKRGADVVKQLLSFARGVEAQRLPVDLVALAGEVQKMVRETFPKDIAFRLEVAPQVWPIEADASQLHQVLTNLCVNARDAMPRGGTLTISLESTMLDEVYANMNIEAHPGPYVVVTVADTGTGIPPHVAEHLFEPFFTTKDVGKGTGLGLSTAHAIVKQHGGFIRVDSEAAKGARFKVYLPSSVGAPSSPAPVDAAVALARGNGELVLVVDDEAAIRTVARRTLERFGYRTLLAANGAEAVALFAQHRGDVAVVLTDMTMPVMDGATTIAALRTIDPRVRVVASSGLVADANVSRAIAAGARHVVPKPYTAETLLKALRQALAEPG